MKAGEEFKDKRTNARPDEKKKGTRTNSQVHRERSMLTRQRTSETGLGSSCSSEGVRQEHKPRTTMRTTAQPHLVRAGSSLMRSPNIPPP